MLWGSKFVFGWSNLWFRSTPNTILRSFLGDINSKNHQGTIRQENYEVLKPAKSRTKFQGTESCDASGSYLPVQGEFDDIFAWNGYVIYCKSLDPSCRLQFQPPQLIKQILHWVNLKLLRRTSLASQVLQVIGIPVVQLVIGMALMEAAPGITYGEEVQTT